MNSSYNIGGIDKYSLKAQENNNTHELNKISEYTRRIFGLIFVIAFIIVALTGLFFGIKGEIKQDSIYNVILSSLSGICGVIIGFYFGQNSK